MDAETWNTEWLLIFLFFFNGLYVVVVVVAAIDGNYNTSKVRGVVYISLPQGLQVAEQLTCLVTAVNRNYHIAMNSLQSSKAFEETGQSKKIVWLTGDVGGLRLRKKPFWQ